LAIGEPGNVMLRATAANERAYGRFIRQLAGGVGYRVTDEYSGITVTQAYLGRHASIDAHYFWAEDHGADTAAKMYAGPSAIGRAVLDRGTGKVLHGGQVPMPADHTQAEIDACGEEARRLAVARADSLCPAWISGGGRRV